MYTSREVKANRTPDPTRNVRIRGPRYILKTIPYVYKLTLKLRPRGPQIQCHGEQRRSRSDLDERYTQAIGG
jgi:hypothetical protein